jgi:ribonuclease-3
MESSSLPYNSKNKLMCDDDLKSLLTRYGIQTRHRDLGIYRLAMVHRSYCTRKNENYVSGNVNCPNDSTVKLQEISNERLEFLGDAVLSLVIAAYIFERYPTQDEGFLTSIRSKLVCGKMLAKLSKQLGISQWVIVSKQVEDDGGRENPKLLEDTLEAFIGAIFLDFQRSGFAMARTFIINVIETFVDFAELVTTIQSSKDRFIKSFVTRYGMAPTFADHPDQIGTNHVQIAVKDRDGCVLAIGSGTNKKEAEIDACNNALLYLGI